MKSYTIEFNGTGEVTPGCWLDDDAAKLWVKSVLEARGYDAGELVTGEWDADGTNDYGMQCYRMLFWENEASAENDAGEKAICQLCKVGE